MKNPPILIAIIGFFAALAGLSFLFFGLQVLGFDWFGALGDVPAFEQVGLWGWLAVATGIVWILAAVGLWALQPWARLFALIMAGLGLFEAVLYMIQYPGSGVGLAMAIMPAIILWYLNSSEVKAAFGEGEPAMAAPVSAPEPVAAPVVAAAAVAAEVAAPEPVEAPVVVAAPAAVEKPQAVHHVKIVDIEGIGPAYAAQLEGAGITTTEDLLAAAATKAGRQKLAETTGISETLILGWVNKADLMRIPGVGTQYSDLLEMAGVDSPAELAQRNPANLAQTFGEAVAARPGTVRRVPTEAEVAGWIEEAKKLAKIVEH